MTLRLYTSVNIIYVSGNCFDVDMGWNFHIITDNITDCISLCVITDKKQFTDTKFIQIVIF